MFNFAFFVKALEITNETPENIDETIKELSQFILYKFSTMLILYVNDKIEDDDEFVKFVEIVETAENRLKGPDDLDVYIKWLEKNSSIDMQEFMEIFEKEMKELELRLTKTLSKSLNNRQKQKLVDSLQKQFENQIRKDIKENL